MRWVEIQAACGARRVGIGIVAQRVSIVAELWRTGFCGSEYAASHLTRRANQLNHPRQEPRNDLGDAPHEDLVNDR